MISAVFPATGPTSGGQVVTIRGAGFDEVTAVNFGRRNAAAFTIDSNSKITATSPPGSGTVEVTVIASGTSLIGAFPYTYFTSSPASSVSASPSSS